MTYAVNRPVPTHWPKGGPQQCDIVVVGDAPSADDVRHGRIFSGNPGYELGTWLKRANIDIEKVMFTNVFSYKPPQDKVAKFFHKKPAAKKLKKETGWESPFPHSVNNGYLKEEYEYDIARLVSEIEQANPNLILVLGGTALWAITGIAPISTYRGTACRSVKGFGSRKVIPTTGLSDQWLSWISTKRLLNLEVPSLSSAKDPYGQSPYYQISLHLNHVTSILSKGQMNLLHSTSRQTRVASHVLGSRPPIKWPSLFPSKINACLTTITGPAQVKKSRRGNGSNTYSKIIDYLNLLIIRATM